MSVTVLKGIYTRRSAGNAMSDGSVHDFIEIGGKRLETVAVDTTLDVFLDENHGKEVEAAFAKASKGWLLCALRCADGTVEKVPLRKVSLMALVAAEVWMLMPVGIVGMIVGGVLFGGGGFMLGVPLVMAAWIAVGPYRRHRNYVQGRDALG